MGQRVGRHVSPHESILLAGKSHFFLVRSTFGKPRTRCRKLSSCTSQPLLTLGANLCYVSRQIKKGDFSLQSEGCLDRRFNKSARTKQKLQTGSQEENKKRNKEARGRSRMWNFLPQAWDGYWNSGLTRIDRGFPYGHSRQASKLSADCSSRMEG